MIVFRGISLTSYKWLIRTFFACMADSYISNWRRRAAKLDNYLCIYVISKHNMYKQKLFIKNKMDGIHLTDLNF